MKKKDNSSSDLIDATKSQFNSVEYFQDQQQLKWLAGVTQMENNDRMKILTFDTTLSKSVGRKLLSIVEK